MVTFVVLIDSIRDEMRRELRRYLYKPNPPTYNLHLNQFAGSGKTTTTCQELDFTDSFFVYLTNNHTIASEQIQNQKVLYDLLQIESRSRLCKNDEYKILSKNGINIKHFCPTCPYISVCEYYQRIIEIWNEPQSWIGVHHHLGGLVNNYVEENDIDAVVIDEYFLNALFKQTRVFYGQIIQTLNLIGGMRDCAEKELIIEFFHEFSFGLQNDTVNNDYLYSEIYHYYRNKRGNNEQLMEFAEEYETRLAEWYFQKGKIFRNIVTPLVDCIIDIYKRYLPQTIPHYLQYMNNVIKVIAGEKRKWVDIARYDLDALNLACKVILLDATTPSAFYKNLFMRDIQSMEKDIRVNSKIYQLSTAKYVMRTLDKNVNTRNRLINIVKDIVNKHKEKTLVLSRIKYEEEIKAANPHFIITDHYPLVGSNEYENINIVVAFGTPEPRRDVLSRQSILLDYPEEELLYIMRELFIVQGIHRIRIALKKDVPTYIYLLTSLPLPFKSVERLPIGHLERLLKNEVVGYVTEDTEDRIRQDIIKLLEKKDTSKSDVLKQITGNRIIVNEVLKRLIRDDMVATYKSTDTGRGRKPLMCKLT